MIGLIVFLVTLVGSHEFYLSRCEMSIGDSRVEASLHVFIDDLELALEKIGHDSLFLGGSGEAEYADRIIEKYLDEKILLNGVKATDRWKVLGKEMSDDLQAFWIHFYTEEISESINYIEIDLLTECYQDQKNILIVESSEGKSHFLLTKSKNTATLK